MPTKGISPFPWASTKLNHHLCERHAGYSGYKFELKEEQIHKRGTEKQHNITFW